MATTDKADIDLGSYLDSEDGIFNSKSGVAIGGLVQQARQRRASTAYCID
jgi:hypothetical protein